VEGPVMSKRWDVDEWIKTNIKDWDTVDYNLDTLRPFIALLAKEGRVSVGSHASALAESLHARLMVLRKGGSTGSCLPFSHSVYRKQQLRDWLEQHFKKTLPTGDEELRAIAKRLVADGLYSPRTSTATIVESLRKRIAEIKMKRAIDEP